MSHTPLLTVINSSDTHHQVRRRPGVRFSNDSESSLALRPFRSVLLCYEPPGVSGSAQNFFGSRKSVGLGLEEFSGLFRNASHVS